MHECIYIPDVYLKGIKSSKIVLKWKGTINAL